MWDSLQTSGQMAGEIWNRRKSGDIYPEWLSIFAHPDNRREAPQLYVAVVFRYQQPIKESERKLYTSLTDQPTGLPNRLLMTTATAGACGAAIEPQSIPLALMFIDLDHFKTSTTVTPCAR